MIRDTKWGGSKKIGHPIKWSSTNNPIVFSSVQMTDELQKTLLSSKWWEEVMDEYFSTILLPEMKRVWATEAAEPLNYPQTIEATSTSDALDSHGTEQFRDNGKPERKPRDSTPKLTQQEARGEMTDGFKLLFEALSHKVSLGSETGIGVGPMGEVMSLKLSRFMPHAKGSTSSSSPYNSLFYAVEYGTGMLAGWDEGQAGNPAFIRTQGETKDPRPRFKGSWWLGPRAGLGIHWKGQQGTHFLFDARTRDPQRHWREFIAETLPKFVTKRLGVSRTQGFRNARTVVNR